MREWRRRHCQEGTKSRSFLEQLIDGASVIALFQMGRCRRGEFTIPSEAAYDPVINDIAFDIKFTPSMILWSHGSDSILGTTRTATRARMLVLGRLVPNSLPTGKAEIRP